MGLAALRKLLDPQPVELSHFRDRTVAVDADNLLWSFVTAFGARGEQPKAPDGRPAGHTLGLLGRLKLYAGHGIKSAWVYDGPQPRLKDATMAQRAARIEDAGTVFLTGQQLAESKELLTALGVPWMEAPSESDPQCASLVHRGVAWAAVTQDYDIALHGCPRAGRNLTGSDTRKPEMLDLAVSLQRAGLTREELVDVAILIGTDYNAGVAGVGPVKAVKLVKAHGGLDGALAALKVEMPEAADVRDLLLRHPVDAAWTPRWRAPDREKVAAILARDGLGAKRGDELCAALERLHRPEQPRLADFA